jgi:hypothetical protein
VASFQKEESMSMEEMEAPGLEEPVLQLQSRLGENPEQR